MNLNQVLEMILLGFILLVFYKPDKAMEYLTKIGNFIAQQIKNYLAQRKQKKMENNN
jgi:hypothetical protein